MTPGAATEAAVVMQPTEALLLERVRIAVVIPCYRVTASIEGVLAQIGDWASAIYCVDDGCPDKSADHIEAVCTDPRVRVVRRAANGGVGAAVCTGYEAALRDGADVLVKVDGDGQMDARLVPKLVLPIAAGHADYVKGNRFFSPRTVASMPWLRLVGNAGLSLLTKLSSGYWDLFDPTNGFTALHAGVARQLDFDRLAKRYFFESDLLFRLGVLRARVVELPAMAVYAEETSHLSEFRALLTFPWYHARNLVKRIAYNYFLRNFSVASVNLVAGSALFAFGATFGAVVWTLGAWRGDPATAGTVMLAGLPVLLGIQLVLSFLAHDVASTPSEPLHPRLSMVEVMRPPGVPDELD
ncbi:MAG: glycosyltransferase family 2 protein [Myxococcales bacterium]|nr:glycosyltransferase family 2 protein [Myxococcales bacterium]